MFLKKKKNLRNVFGHLCAPVYVGDSNLWHAFAVTVQMDGFSGSAVTPTGHTSITQIDRQRNCNMKTACASTASTTAHENTVDRAIHQYYCRRVVPLRTTSLVYLFDLHSQQYNLYLYLLLKRRLLSIVTIESICTSDLLINIFRSLIFIASNIVRRRTQKLCIDETGVRRHRMWTQRNARQNENCRAAFRVYLCGQH